MIIFCWASKIYIILPQRCITMISASSVREYAGIVQRYAGGNLAYRNQLVNIISDCRDYLRVYNCSDKRIILNIRRKYPCADKSRDATNRLYELYNRLGDGFLAQAKREDFSLLSSFLYIAAEILEARPDNMVTGGHTANASGDTADKHQKGDGRRIQDQKGSKAKQKPGWVWR